MIAAILPARYAEKSRLPSKEQAIGPSFPHLTIRYDIFQLNQEIKEERNVYEINVNNKYCIHDNIRTINHIYLV